MKNVPYDMSLFTLFSSFYWEMRYWKFTNTNTTPQFIFNKPKNWRIFEQSLRQSTGTLFDDVNSVVL